MIVLAVLLLILVALAVLFIVVTGSTTHLVLAWQQISLSWATTALVVFLLGAVTLLVAEAGVALLLRGNRRNWARRQELKRLRRVEQDRSRTPTGVRPSAPVAPAPAAAPAAEVPGRSAAQGQGPGTGQGSTAAHD